MKHPGGARVSGRCPVAPRAGAWIETSPEGGLLAFGVRSPPARGRGLKLKLEPVLAAYLRRPPRGGVD